jgi:hypothetical protein
VRDVEVDVPLTVGLSPKVHGQTSQICRVLGNSPAAPANQGVDRPVGITPMRLTPAATASRNLS